MNNYILMLIIIVGLTACGGGGESSSPVPDTPSSDSGNSGSDDDSNSGNDDSNSDDDDASDDSGSDTIMSDLVIDKSFALKTDVNLLIDAKISASNVRAYLNVCQAVAETGKADYQNCVLRKPLVNGELSQQVVLSRQDIALVAEIWLYDTNPEPLRFQWQFEEGSTQQKFEIRY
ncbi:hypothetical protein [Pseudoalteromonas phenolica]|uniref:hypothetical protein n=1 Tax=Pseudoalteromonas phenolica TaxID=161398 RepID=UPI00110A9E1D|nr:hypothetical protein [Pseudoalteromonas phenolica]TMO57168.1 hypothetical protein CWC21_04610 [Pseudoalteromonas phenolica]